MADRRKRRQRREIGRAENDQIAKDLEMHAQELDLHSDGGLGAIMGQQDLCIFHL